MPCSPAPMRPTRRPDRRRSRGHWETACCPSSARESAQLADNLGVAQLVLTAEQVARLDAASAAPALEADVDPQARGDAVVVRPGGIAAAVVGVLDHAVDR